MALALPHGAHVRANGIRQHYLHYPGGSQPLVIVPGIVSPAALWQHVAEHLSPRFTVYVLDVRGRGLSEQGSHLNYGLDVCSDDLNAFCAALRLDSPLLLGHSMGARVATRAVARGLVAHSLVLVDPPVSGPGRRPYPIGMQRTLDMLQACLRGEGEAYLRRPGVAPWPELMLCQRAQWMASCDPRVIEAAYEDFHGQDFFSDVAALNVPSYLLVAGASGVILPEDMAELQAGQPLLRAQTLEGAAHQMQAENTVQFLGALDALFESMFVF